MTKPQATKMTAPTTTAPTTTTPTATSPRRKVAKRSINLCFTYVDDTSIQPSQFENILKQLDRETLGALIAREDPLMIFRMPASEISVSIVGHIITLNPML